MKRVDLIDKYLAGNLDDQEAFEFKKLRASNPDFEKDITFFEDLTRVVDEDERLRLKASLGQKSKAREKNSKSKKWILLLIFALILALLSLIYISLLSKESSPDAIYASYFDVYPNTFQPVTRNGEDNTLNQAFTAYEKGNFQVANTKFAQSQDQAFDPRIAFFYGNSLAATKDFEAAKENFLKVLSSDSEYIVEAYWYLSLLALIEGSDDIALSYIEDYLNFDGEKKFVQEATELMKTLEQR